jgi:ribosomal protein S18 acetylase RimI-like enzyme
MIAVPSSSLLYSKHIRRLDVSQDLNAVADLIELCFPIHRDQDGQDYIREMRKAARDMRLAGWLSTLAEMGSSKSSGFVWEEDEHIVGNLSLIPFKQSSVRFHMIANVAVHPEFRERGIARALTERAMQYLRQKGEPYAWLQVRDDNPAATHLYRSVGFKDKLTRTTWRIQPIMSESSRLYTDLQVRLRGRRKGDWESQKRWLAKFYPTLMWWNLPVNFQRFEPGFFQDLVNLLNGDFQRHWAFELEDCLKGIITWQKTKSFANNLWLAFPQEVEEVVLRQALKLVLRRASRKHSLSIDAPKGWYSNVFSGLGFQLFRTLVWMRCDF